MKTGIFALTLLTSSGLFAGSNNYTQESCSTCCACPCTCKPCCVPQPKKCIDCECYTPAYYDLQCDWGAFISVDFLYWYANESNLPYAAIGTAQEANIELAGLDIISYVPITSAEYLNASWDPGVRVGLGWNSSCDGWDSNITWTYLKNSQKQTTKVANFSNPDFLLPNEEANYPSNGQKVVIPGVLGTNSFAPQDGSAPLSYFTSVEGKWKIQFNQIDWELGRKYWLSQCFSLRPYTALRGAWTKISFDILATRPTSPDGEELNRNQSFQTTARNWGVGFLGGVQPNWHFCSNFILYANMDVALL